MTPADKMASERQMPGAGAGCDEKSDQQLRAILENLQRVNPQRNPVEADNLLLGTNHRHDHDTPELNAIHHRLVSMENEMKRRGSRGSPAIWLLFVSALPPPWRGNLTA